MSFGKNFIKPLPEGEDAAIDESLLLYQVRTRKGSDWEKVLRNFVESINNGGVGSK